MYSGRPRRGRGAFSLPMEDTSHGPRRKTRSQSRGLSEAPPPRVPTPATPIQEEPTPPRKPTPRIFPPSSPNGSRDGPRIRQTLLSGTSADLRSRADALWVAADEYVHAVLSAGEDDLGNLGESEEMWTVLQSTALDILVHTTGPFVPVQDVVDDLRDVCTEDDCQAVSGAVKKFNFSTFLRVVYRPDRADALWKGKREGRTGSTHKAIQDRNSVLYLAWKNFWTIVPEDLYGSTSALEQWLQFATQIYVAYRCRMINPYTQINEALPYPPDFFTMFDSPDLSGRIRKQWVAMLRERELELKDHDPQELLEIYDYNLFRTELFAFVKGFFYRRHSVDNVDEDPVDDEDLSVSDRITNGSGSDSSENEFVDVQDDDGLLPESSRQETLPAEAEHAVQQDEVQHDTVEEGNVSDKEEDMGDHQGDISEAFDLAMFQEMVAEMEDEGKQPNPDDGDDGDGNGQDELPTASQLDLEADNVSDSDEDLLGASLLPRETQLNPGHQADADESDSHSEGSDSELGDIMPSESQLNPTGDPPRLNGELPGIEEGDELDNDLPTGSQLNPEDDDDLNGEQDAEPLFISGGSSDDDDILPTESHFDRYGSDVSIKSEQMSEQPEDDDEVIEDEDDDLEEGEERGVLPTETQFAARDDDEVEDDDDDEADANDVEAGDDDDEAEDEEMALPTNAVTAGEVDGDFEDIEAENDEDVDEDVNEDVDVLPTESLLNPYDGETLRPLAQAATQEVVQETEGQEPEADITITMETVECTEITLVSSPHPGSTRKSLASRLDAASAAATSSNTASKETNGLAESPARPGNQAAFFVDARRKASEGRHFASATPPVDCQAARSLSPATPVPRPGARQPRGPRPLSPRPPPRSSANGRQESPNVLVPYHHEQGNDYPPVQRAFDNVDQHVNDPPINDDDIDNDEALRALGDGESDDDLLDPMDAPIQVARNPQSDDKFMHAKDGSPLVEDPEMVLPKGYRRPQSRLFGRVAGKKSQYVRKTGTKKWDLWEAYFLYRAVQTVPMTEPNPCTVVEYMHGEFGKRDQCLRFYNAQHMKDKMRTIVNVRINNRRPVVGRARHFLPTTNRDKQKYLRELEAVKRRQQDELENRIKQEEEERRLEMAASDHEGSDTTYKGKGKGKARAEPAQTRKRSAASAALRAEYVPATYAHFPAPFDIEAARTPTPERWAVPWRSPTVVGTPFVDLSDRPTPKRQKTGPGHSVARTPALRKRATPRPPNARRASSRVPKSKPVYKEIDGDVDEDEIGNFDEEEAGNFEEEETENFAVDGDERMEDDEHSDRALASVPRSRRASSRVPVNKPVYAEKDEEADEAAEEEESEEEGQENGGPSKENLTRGDHEQMDTAGESRLPRKTRAALRKPAHAVESRPPAKLTRSRKNETETRPVEAEPEEEEEEEEPDATGAASPPRKPSWAVMRDQEEDELDSDGAEADKDEDEDEANEAEAVEHSDDTPTKRKRKVPEEETDSQFVRRELIKRRVLGF